MKFHYRNSSNVNEWRTQIPICSSKKVKINDLHNFSIIYPSELWQGKYYVNVLYYTYLVIIISQVGSYTDCTQSHTYMFWAEIRSQSQLNLIAGIVNKYLPCGQVGCGVF